MNTATFSAGQSVSNAILVAPSPVDVPNNRYLVAKVKTGDTWTSATLGLYGSLDGTNYFPIKVAGSYIGITPTTTNWDAFLVPFGFKYFKLFSHNGSGTPTNQVSAVNIEFVLSGTVQ